MLCRAWTLWTVGVLAALALTAVSSAKLAAGAGLQAKLAAQKNPIAASAESIKAGSIIYAKNCRACHGLRGKGDGTAAPPGSKPANLVDAKWDHGSSDAEIFKTVKEGVAPDFFMEPWADRLSDSDIWNTINYLRDLAQAANRPKP